MITLTMTLEEIKQILVVLAVSDDMDKIVAQLGQDWSAKAFTAYIDAECITGSWARETKVERRNDAEHC